MKFRPFWIVQNRDPKAKTQRGTCMNTGKVVIDVLAERLLISGKFGPKDIINKVWMREENSPVI